MEKDKVDIELYRKYLERKIGRTKMVRFNAYDRLTNLNKVSNMTTAFLSSYLIILSVITILFKHIESIYADIVPYMTIAIALVLLVFNLVESKKEYKFNAEKMHNCARELLRLELKIKYISYEKYKTDDAELYEYREISKKYADILDKFDGHAAVDFNLLRVKEFEIEQEVNDETSNNGKKSMNRFQVRKYKFTYYVAYYIKYWILLFIPLPLIWLFVYPIVMQYVVNLTKGLH